MEELEQRVGLKLVRELTRREYDRMKKEGPEQDFLGECFMLLDMGNRWKRR